MKQVVILGAHGQIARLVTAMLLKESVHQTLFLRHANRLTVTDTAKETLLEGDTSNLTDLERALSGQDIVYANLAGKNIVQQAQNIVTAMKSQQVKRLIWISTLGIYDEVPGTFGQWNHDMLDGGYLEDYAAAARIIETSNLDYTIIRPAWLTNKDEVDFELTQKGEAFKGTEVSRKSIAALVTQLIITPETALHASLGVDKPGTAGDKPAWY
ncbi:hypothetical protein RU97_GL001959 [Enterococcus canis]|uniref:NAD(P)-binding domain-containing protein n=2 Tax=Enterococcus canis TaxID=214095 RepID=A0A1L8RFU1_9ENTE|nr:SDR family oxidoreductase [Enterococcus canis]OJG18562.1 hypothetical protein RU97_GL001959 [Enterococcus canis]